MAHSDQEDMISLPIMDRQLCLLRLCTNIRFRAAQVKGGAAVAGSMILAEDDHSLGRPSETNVATSKVISLRRYQGARILQPDQTTRTSGLLTCLVLPANGSCNSFQAVWQGMIGKGCLQRLQTIWNQQRSECVTIVELWCCPG